MMANVKFEYDPMLVDSLTVDTFDFISSGREVVVSGRINEENLKGMQAISSEERLVITGKVTGRGSSSEVVIDFEVDPFKVGRAASSANKVRGEIFVT